MRGVGLVSGGRVEGHAKVDPREREREDEWYIRVSHSIIKHAVCLLRLTEDLIEQLNGLLLRDGLLIRGEEGLDDVADCDSLFRPHGDWSLVSMAKTPRWLKEKVEFGRVEVRK